MGSRQRTIALALAASSAVACLLEVVAIFKSPGRGSPDLAVMFLLTVAAATHAALALANGVVASMLGPKVGAGGRVVAWIWLALAAAAELVLFGGFCLWLLLSAI